MVILLLSVFLSFFSVGENVGQTRQELMLLEDFKLFSLLTFARVLFLYIDVVCLFHLIVFPFLIPTLPS